MKLFSLDSPVIRFLDKLGKIMIVNICFLVYSLPVVTIGPSVTAMYRCFLTLAEDRDSGILKLFWKAFRQNFRKALLLELCVFPVTATAVLEALFFLSGLSGGKTVQGILYILPFVLVSCVVTYIFPLQAQFENKISGTIKNSVIFALCYFPATIFMTAVNLVFPVMLYFFTGFFLRFLVFWLFAGFGLSAYVNTMLLRKIFAQYITDK